MHAQNIWKMLRKINVMIENITIVEKISKRNTGKNKEQKLILY